LETDAGVVISVQSKEVTASLVPEIFDEARALLGDASAVVLDMGAVTFLDSSAIGAWVRFVREQQARAVDLRIAGVSPHLMELIQMMRLDQLMDFSPDVAEAFRRIEQRSAQGPGTAQGGAG
jgi:anti-sigma B factor antagonist